MLAGAAVAEDRPPPFIDARSVVPGLATDIRYAGTHNFTRAPVPGYEAPRCWLTRQAAEALARVAVDLRPQGYGLKVYDCYRPARAVRSFVAWARNADERGKREFFPRVAKRDLFRLGYIADHSAHSRGSTVDLTLIEAKSGRELDMGTPSISSILDRILARRRRRRRPAAIARRSAPPWSAGVLRPTIRNGGISP